MSGTIQIARLFGIGIKLHFSWIFIFLLISWSLAGSFLPQNYPGWNSNTYWVVGIMGSVLLFVCVLIHELSHSLVAMSRGYKVSGITLFFLGGVSEIAEEAADAGEEFWIAIVGPLASLVLAAIFGGLLSFAFGSNSPAEALFFYRNCSTRVKQRTGRSEGPLNGLKLGKPLTLPRVHHRAHCPKQVSAPIGAKAVGYLAENSA
ncbi:MAG: site-2 protease family protein [Chloroflexi bacterium]|nr:site-2 protease family protein [Chloroflexota bacterium]